MRIWNLFDIYAQPLSTSFVADLICFFSDACNGRKSLRAQDNSLTFNQIRTLLEGINQKRNLKIYYKLQCYTNKQIF